MQITGVETTALYRELNAWGRGKIDQDIVLIRISTDSGITGISYLPLIQMWKRGTTLVSQGSHAAPVVALINQHFRPILLGADPLANERIWEEMYSSCQRYNRSGLAIQCLSALDVALWDIKGKAANMPLYKLLGGYRDRCLAYVNCNHIANPPDVAKQAAEYVAQGFKAIKFRGSSMAGSLEDATERLRLTREAVGPGVKLLVDCSQDWDTATTLRMAARWADYDVALLENPIPEPDVRGYSRLVAAIDIPIACGQHFSDRWQFMERVDARAASVFNPDALSSGGVTEYLRIAGLASAAGIPLIPHAGELLHVHLVCALPGAIMIEHFTPDMPIFGGFFHELFNAAEEFRVPVDGYVRAPNRPGLGLEVNEKLVAKYRVS